MSLQSTLIRAACVVSTGAFCVAASAANISPAAHDSARKELQTTYKAEREACNKLSGNAKDVCEDTVDGKEKVAMAHLKFMRSGDAKDRIKVNQARYEARYEVAKEMCDDQAGNAKDVCVAKAKADRDKAKADVKLAKQTTEARNDAADVKEKADYKVASERCDAMSGNAKDSCVASARARYGQ